MIYKIPLTLDPDQNFKCTVPISGKNLSLFFRIRFNTVAKYWTISVSNSKGEILVDNIPLVTGVDLLGQFAHLGLGSAVVAKTGKSTMDSPDDTNLGTEFVLLWG